MSQFVKSTGRIHGKFLYHAGMIFFLMKMDHKQL